MHSTSACFFTVTYSQEYLPRSKNGFMTLHKKDIQDFMKRVRQYMIRKHKSPHKVSYYCAGEYGGKFKRPHYHIIVFNASIQALESSWFKGSYYFGIAGEASVGYTLKYLNKVAERKKFSRDDRVPEFQLVSKGMGAGFLTQEMINFYKSHLYNRLYCTTREGVHIPMPKYYYNKIFNDEEKQQIAQGIAEKYATGDIQAAEPIRADIERLNYESRLRSSRT